ncbi:MAG: hypothetical protein IJ479_08005 [Alphaproteobacteria bacterium]|nr:hypothetical protein [Alphaproteobacteria bacterium]
MNYKPDKLRLYIEKSELRVISKNLKVRLSKELAANFDKGIYNDFISFCSDCINQILGLNIKYPAKAKPIFYIYIVPDENFVELLSYPFPEKKGGGRPVSCYDLDGFVTAYGISQNLCIEQYKYNSISVIENNIHEFSHNVHHMFFGDKNRLIAEGFAETLPLYILGYEEKFDEHRHLIINLKQEQIYTAQELIIMEKEGTFGRKTRVENKSCSFDWSYISSYLFVTGYIISLEKKFNISKIAAMQKFLEILTSSPYRSQFLIFELADIIDCPHEKLLNEKYIQNIAIKRISVNFS